ncbi:MAG: TlpA family protein disulfide reductase [Hyphomicrobiaceae bacterium]|nr:MAG: TlpA family protein disulfide reductase [Hyphomicrobiaceae bacterium]
MTAFVVKPEPEVLPEIAFENLTAGKSQSLKDYAGRVVLLNLWATWCAPCLREMPSLDRLKAAMSGKDFEVVALSIDKGGPEKPKKFFADAGIKALALIQDKEGKAFAALKIVGMPTTLLIGRDGKEIGRLVGPAEWDSEDAKALIRAAIAR